MGRSPQEGHAMPEGAGTTPENRYTYKTFIDNGLIYSEWGHEILSLSIEGPCKK